jgi:mRNA interferase MazF
LFDFVCWFCDTVEIMEKDFDRWNGEKKRIHFGDDGVILYPKEREVWLCIIGKNVGVEQNGSTDTFSRPVLVVKKFNNKMFWVVPLSTKQKKYDFFYNFVDENGTSVAAILAQLRLVSIKRFVRKVSEHPFPEAKFSDIVRHLIEFFENRKPS